MSLGKVVVREGVSNSGRVELDPPRICPAVGAARRPGSQAPAQTGLTTVISIMPGPRTTELLVPSDHAVEEKNGSHTKKAMMQLRLLHSNNIHYGRRRDCAQFWRRTQGTASMFAWRMMLLTNPAGWLQTG